MTGYQIFALSMPVITAAVVGLTALFVRWRWGKRGQIHHADVALTPVEKEISADLDSAIRLIDGVRRKLQTHA